VFKRRVLFSVDEPCKMLFADVLCLCAGRNIYRQLFCRKLPERNELFLPGRMAYVVDLEDDFGESDIPTTLIRSKADCPSLEVCSAS